jgi:hypothetical protein
MVLQYSNLHGHTLEKADSANYLGITIQNNLKWDKHINTITAKANQSLGFIKRNLKVHSPAIKEHGRTSSGAQFKSDIISVTELVLWYLLLT